MTFYYVIHVSLYVCMHAHKCVCIPVCLGIPMCAHTCEGQRKASFVILPLALATLTL